MHAAQRIQQKRDQYPEITFDESEGTPEFVKLVLRATEEISPSEPKLFSSW